MFYKILYNNGAVALRKMYVIYYILYIKSFKHTIFCIVFSKCDSSIWNKLFIKKIM